MIKYPIEVNVMEQLNGIFDSHAHYDQKRFDEDRVKFLRDENVYLDRLEELGIDCTYLRTKLASQ